MTESLVSVLNVVVNVLWLYLSYVNKSLTCTWCIYINIDYSHHYMYTCTVKYGSILSTVRERVHVYSF